MKRLVLVITTLGCLGLTNCSTLNQSYNGPKLSLILNNFKIGMTTKIEVESLLGKPSKMLTISADEENWIYTSGPYDATRLSVSFNPNGNQIESFSWFVKDYESESNLDYLTKMFPGSSFSKMTAPWENSHFAPDEIYFVDKKSGVKIEFGNSKKKVKSFSVYDPSLINKKAPASENSKNGFEI